MKYQTNERYLIRPTGGSGAVHPASNEDWFEDAEAAIDEWEERRKMLSPRQLIEVIRVTETTICMAARG